MFPPQGPHRPWAWVFLRDAPPPQPSPCPLMSVPATPSVLESLDGMCPLVPGPGSRAPPLSLLTPTSLTTELYGFSTFLGSPSNPVPSPSPRLWVSPLFPPQLWGSPNPDGPWACPHHVTNRLCNPAPSPDPPRGDFRGGLCSVPAGTPAPPPRGLGQGINRGGGCSRQQTQPSTTPPCLLWRLHSKWGFPKGRSPLALGTPARPPSGAVVGPTQGAGGWEGRGPPSLLPLLDLFLS